MATFLSGSGLAGPARIYFCFCFLFVAILLLLQCCCLLLLAAAVQLCCFARKKKKKWAKLGKNTDLKPPLQL